MVYINHLYMCKKIFYLCNNVLPKIRKIKYAS